MSIFSSSCIECIISFPPALLHGILNLRLGDAETGNGAGVSDVSIIRLVKLCPNLTHVKLDGATNLTDATLLAIFVHCPRLRYVQLSGNDKVTGQLNGTALDTLRENPDMGKNLAKLRLTDQDDLRTDFEKALRTLSVTRKKLAIEVGCTHERHGDVSTWLGGKKRSGYQAFGGPGNFDSFCGFGRSRAQLRSF